MRVFRGLPAAADAPIALTIGTFDGIHRGHQAMLSRLREAAEDLALPASVLTFDPHPREFFAPASAPPRLSTLRDKLDRFAAHGVERTYVARFDARLASIPPDMFIDDVLVLRLGTRWLLVGDDFRFGRGRAGDTAMLRSASSPFSVEVLRTVMVDGERASSTVVRDALADADLERAARLMARPYTMSGHVVHGRKLGRSLGFPTANIPLHYRPPLSGIFAVRVHGLGSTPRTGAASLGVRPTITSEGKPLLEVFIFDFDEAIYGRRITVEFMHKLRHEERYDDLDALTTQIGRDVAQAREYFAARG